MILAGYKNNEMMNATLCYLETIKQINHETAILL